MKYTILKKGVGRARSPSAWKEWIEMQPYITCYMWKRSLLPHGRSGLKYHRA
ncbi:hypothetical protein CLOHYLEM_04914 [[Clostridium] hylemonae DSM 15053]|uniref:Uncharacterized protein n=1 Tax=[Clostridium] hylemonae DSM 15053 TaxID=553973 RepID=C0BYM5_9FIRM|nr:hypothetical protein CLOHYLEM_04914 [[Clostridium] hylemonae DSM 15053]